MDQNVRDVLIALLTVAGGFATAIVVTALTSANARRLERERWKRGLYATLVHETNGIRDALRAAVSGVSPDEGWADGIERAQRAIAEIRMLEPRMESATSALWDATGKLVSLIPKGRSPMAEYVALDEACRQGIEAFIAKAQEDLA